MENDSFVKLDDVGEDTIRLAGLLTSDLAVKTTGKSQRLLMRLEQPSNGFDWQRLTRLAEGGGGIKNQEGRSADQSFEFVL